MSDQFEDALEDDGYEVVDSFDDIVVIELTDVEINGQEFEHAELTTTTGADELRFGVVDVYDESGHELTDEQKSALDELGVVDDLGGGNYVWEVDSEQVENFSGIKRDVQSIYSRTRSQ